MLTLVEPTVRLRDAWLDAHCEWGAGPHEDGFGVGDADVETEHGFADWVARLVRLADPSTPVAPGESHSSFRGIVEDGGVLGGIVLRHDLTEFVSRMGHIGYGVRPSARRRGVATWALGRCSAKPERSVSIAC